MTCLTALATVALVVGLRAWCLADRALIQAELAEEAALRAQKTADAALAEDPE